jgi:hypothetical protein
MRICIPHCFVIVVGLLLPFATQSIGFQQEPGGSVQAQVLLVAPHHGH